MRHCRLRNLSPRGIEYYRENLNYVWRVLNLEYADELTRERIDDLVAHEMDKGNIVVAINSRIRGLRVFVHFCADREYLDDFKYQLLKTEQEQKEPYTDVSGLNCAYQACLDSEYHSPAMRLQVVAIRQGSFKLVLQSIVALAPDLLTTLPVALSSFKALMEIIKFKIALKGKESQKAEDDGMQDLYY